MQEFKERKVYDLDNSCLKRAGAPGSSVTVNVEEDAAAMPTGEAMLFATSTCPNCKIAASLLDKAGVSYKKLLVDENRELAGELKLKQAPTLVVEINGEPIKYVGAPEIKKYIETLSV